MKKKTITIILVVAFLIGIISGTVFIFKKGEGPLTTDPVIEAEVVEEVTPEVTEIVEPEIEEVVEPETEEVIEVTPEPETEITEVPEPETTEVPTEVTPETTTIKVVEPTPTPTPTPAPTEAAPTPTEAPTEVPTPTTASIIEVTEEEMITGKYNTFTEVISEYDLTSPYYNDVHGRVFHCNEVTTITINNDGLKSSGSGASYVTNTEWTGSGVFDSTFKYGETKWIYTAPDGWYDEEKQVELTKDITKFGFDFARFKVNKSETSKDTITITGTYTLSSTPNTIYGMLAVGVLKANDIVGNINKVTANVTITLDSNTKSMEKVVLKYNMNGEVFGSSIPETGEINASLESYTHTFTFK